MRSNRVFSIVTLCSVSFSLFLSACGAPGTGTGVAINPCLETTWKTSSYCQTGPVQAKFNKGVSLNLAEIPEELLTNRLKIPLEAQALLSQLGSLPGNSFVEFTVDGKVVGKVPAKDVAALTNFFFQLLDPLTVGAHTAVALLKNADGTLITTSNTIQFVIPPVSSNSEKPAIGLLSPLAVTPVLAGTKLAFLADAHLPAGLAGEKVEFWSNNKLLGSAIKNPDGTYRYEFDTTGFAPGTYPVLAILKDSAGKEIARSQSGQFVIAEPFQIQSLNNLSLALLNLSGKTELLIGGALPLSGLLQFKGSLPAGAKLKFFANGLEIAQAIADTTGHYRFEWLTTGFKAGLYTLEAKLFDNKNQVLTTSNALKITLKAQANEQSKVTLADLPAKAFPGSKVPIKASVQLPPNIAPSQIRVEFVVNGRVIGSGTRNPDGTWSITWDTSNLPPGDYDIKAVVYGPDGPLAESLVRTVKLDPVSQTSIILTTGNLSASPGRTIPLTAQVQVSQQELANGAYVEFRANGKLIGRGVLQADGTWKLDWNTTDLPIGEYQIEASLVSGSGAVLSRSNQATITLNQQIINQVSLLNSQITAKAGSLIPITARTILDVNVQNPSVKFISNGQVLGSGVRQNDGTWLLDWDTSLMLPGEYPIQAVLYDGKGQELDRSELGTIKLDAQINNSIVLSRPNNGASYSRNSVVPFEATIAITDAVRQAGFIVEFYRNGSRIDTGTEQSPNQFVGSWNANSSGDQQIKAVLKNLQGQILAESNLANISIENQNGGGGGSSNTSDPAITLQNPTALSTVRVAQGESFDLKAIATIPSNLNSQNPFVEFVADGSTVLGRGTLSSGVWTFSWNSSSMNVGTHSVVARIVTDSNASVVVSELGTIELISNAIELNTPEDNTDVDQGDSVLLRATPALSDSQTNATVEFYDGSTLLGTGTRQSDGSYTFDWDTSESSAGSHEMSAKLVFNSSTLATSSASTVNVNVFENTISLNTPANNSTITQGDAVELKATPTLQEDQIEDAIVNFYDGDTLIGAGTRQEDGSYTLSWNTDYLSTGSHQITAKLVLNSNTLATSTSSSVTVEAFDYAIQLNTPTDNTQVTQGDSVPLKATPTILDSQINDAVVEFLYGTTVIGSGTRQSDGSYTLNWDTSDIPDGDYQITARVVYETQTLATSTVADLTIAPFDYVITLNGPADNSVYDQGDSVPLKATPTLMNESQLEDVIVKFYDGTTLLGSGTLQVDGSFTFDWDTSESSSGSHNITAKLELNSQTLATSSAVNIYLNPNFVNVGPVPTFEDLGEPSQGPGYLDIPLPTGSFDPDSLPNGTYFTDMPADLNTQTNYTGTHSSLIEFFFGDGSGYPSINPAGSDLTFDSNPQITDYDADYYGETHETGNANEYINRTRVVVNEVTGQQSVTTLDTGIRSSDTGLSLGALGAAKVTLASSTNKDAILAGSTFTIDFGDNGTFDFATVFGSNFNASVNTIDDIIQAINDYGNSLTNGGTVSASIINGKLTINNDPPDSVSTSGFIDPVHFVESQIKLRFGTKNSDIVTLNNPSDETISTVLTKINATFPGAASFDWTSVNGDKLILDMDAIDAATTTSYKDVYGKHILLLVDSGADGTGDSESNGLDLGQFFKLNYVNAATYASANSISDVAFGANDGVLVADGNGDIISSQDIDNGDDVNGSDPLEITSDIAINTSLASLESMITSAGDNSITFGTDPTSVALLDFFNISNKANTGTGLNQATVSSTDISSTVNIQPGETATIAELLDVQVPSTTGVTGALVIDGVTLISDVSSKTILEIVDAIDGFVSGDKVYTASFNSSTGKLTIVVTDIEALSAPASSLSPAPSAGVKKNSNELTNDTSAYTLP